MLLFPYNIFFQSQPVLCFTLLIKPASNARCYRFLKMFHTDGKFSFALLWTSKFGSALTQTWHRHIWDFSPNHNLQAGSQTPECTFSPLLSWSDMPPHPTHLYSVIHNSMLKSRVTGIVSNAIHASTIIAITDLWGSHDLHWLIWNTDKGQKEKIAPQRGENIYSQNWLLPWLMRCLVTKIKTHQKLQISTFLIVWLFSSQNTRHYLQNLKYCWNSTQWK